MQKLHWVLAMVVAAAGCSDNVSSDEQAKQAYVGLDKSIGKSITLGFAGFNAASSANIPQQMTAGDAGGTIVISGQVDQGSSANKEMRLYAGMTSYSDGKVTVDGTDLTITYATDADMATQPYLQMSLKGIPTGTLSGALTGTYHMTGDLKGDVTLNLTFNGTLTAGANNTVVRVVGSTIVTGTATSGDGMYAVNVTL